MIYDIVLDSRYNFRIRRSDLPDREDKCQVICKSCNKVLVEKMYKTDDTDKSIVNDLLLVIKENEINYCYKCSRILKC